MIGEKNNDILDKTLSGSQVTVRSGFGYNAQLPNGQQRWIGNQADLDAFLQEAKSQGGADGYTTDVTQRNDAIGKCLRS